MSGVCSQLPECGATDDPPLSALPISHGDVLVRAPYPHRNALY